jgi:hypothetical protein
MRAFISAIASVALTLAEVDHADVEEHLSLLQLSAKPRSVAENSDDLDAYVGDLDLDLERGTPYTWAAPADLRRGFGPDGTWATPYCKHIQGCLKEERSCPAGCNGAAYWEWTNPANSRLGVPNSMGAAKGKRMHYLGCQQGMNRGGAIGSFSFHDCYMNCFNGPDSDKPAITSSDPAWPAQNKINMQGIDPSQTFYQNEFCPADCVNDCAFFKLGQFLGCGFIPPPIMSTSGRPSAYCPVGKIGALQQYGAVGASSWTWCGEPTTTTTTTPPPPPPPPIEEPVDGNEAAAEGDPHLTSSTGSHKDLCCEGGVCRPCQK